MKFDWVNQQIEESDAPRKDHRSERGYALVALMGVMMFALILTTAAAPTIKMETQREREEEMLWRGQQVAAAVSRYFQMRNQYPTDLNDLVEGIEVGTKKIRLLRPSALCDPMMPCEPGSINWRLVHPGDPLAKELLDAYVSTQQKSSIILPPPPGNLVQLAQLGAPGASNLPGQPADTKLDGNSGPANPSGGDSGSSPSDKAPIVGVVSRKTDKMFRSYYGIEYYDHTLFFPGVPVIAGGFINPMSFGVSLSSGSVNAKEESPCPKGGMPINGKCWGVLYPGNLCRGPNGTSVPCDQLNK